jgi:hypothetical protein
LGYRSLLRVAQQNQAPGSKTSADKIQKLHPLPEKAQSLCPLQKILPVL